MSTASFRNFSGTAAELYERVFVPTISWPVAGELLRAAALRPGERVVDVACGTGVVARAAAERVGSTGTVVGVDVSDDMIDVATATPAAGAPIEWHVADATALPLADASCDVALCQIGLMFVEDAGAVLAEMRRVLVPGGRVVVNTPGRMQPRFRELERAIAGHIDPQLGAFVSVVFSMSDPDELAGRLTGAGFDDVASREHTTHLELPEPAEFLWNYINLTPMGPFVAQAPPAAHAAMERELVDAWTPHVVDRTTPVDQPVVLASGVRP